MNRAIPILMYHQVGHEPQKFYPLHSIEPKNFANQMKLLKSCGFETIDLSQLYEYRNGSGEIPQKPIVITFDDGYQDSIDNSVPALEACGFKAIYYIPTDYIGTDSHWMKSDLGIELPIADWDTIKQIDSKGFDIGCHSMSHPHLNQISGEKCLNELKTSKKILEEKLGHEVKHLAYPYGSYNESVMSAAGETGFITACTVDAGLCKSKYDSLALPRINIGYKDSVIDFVSKIHTGFSPYNGARNLLRKIKYKSGL